jgi:hypothetical protein
MAELEDLSSGSKRMNRTIAALTLCMATVAHASPPTVVAPGVISGPAHDSAPAFTPDGKTVYFTRSNPAASTILVSHRTAVGWSTPAIAPFSGEWNDMEPAMAPDGSFLVFVSSRPAKSGGPILDGTFSGKTFPGGGGNLWRVDRRDDGWGKPVRLPDTINRTSSTFAPAVVRDGSVYFMKVVKDGRFGLFRAQRTADGYAVPTRVAFSDPQWGDVDPAVAPDESYAVFSSTRPPARHMDLFFVRRARDGSWTTPVHLGTEVNSAGSDAESRLSPDGKTLYFASDRVLPVTFPRSHADAVRDLDRMSWDNSLYNIWQLDLSPWLDAKP